MGTTTLMAGSDQCGNGRLARLFATHAPRLRAFVRRQVRNWADADDIVQEAFLELVGVDPLLDPFEHISAWLNRVARNRIIDRFRRHGRERLVSDLEFDERTATDPEPGGVLAQWLAAVEQGPEASAQRAELLEAITNAIAQLSADQQAVFIAHEIDGLSFQELAAERGVSISTLLGRKHAAVVQLRRRLANEYSLYLKSSEGES
jgi:RNA polymerase sigma factor (sigma-70 family)